MDYYALDLGHKQPTIAKGDGLNVFKFFIYNVQTREWENNLHWAMRVLYDDFLDYKIITEQEAMAYLQSTI